MNSEFLVRLRKTGRRSTRGMSLIEVMIVIAIIGTVMGVVAMGLWPKFKKSQATAARIGAQEVRKAAELYMSTDASSDACPTADDVAKAKYLDADKISDPWGTPYKIVCGEGGMRVIAAGKDRKDGTADDIKDNYKDSDINKVVDAM